MKTIKSFYVVFLAILVVLAIAAVFFSRLANREEMASGLAARQLLEAEKQIRRAQEQMESAEKKRNALGVELEELQKKSEAEKSRILKNPVLSGPQMGVAAASENDPRLVALHLASRRAAIAGTYAGLVRALGLSREQTETFVDLVLRREEQAGDIYATARQQGLAYSDSAVVGLLRQVGSDYEVAQKSLLGEQAFNQLKEYERTIPAREIASGLAGAAVVTGAPFSVQQSEQLTQLIALSSSAYEEGGPFTSSQIDWEVVDAQARQILSDEQFRIFTTFEPQGANYAGARWLVRLNLLLGNAVKADKTNATAMSGR